MLETIDGAMSVEIFAAKDSSGELDGMVIMAVPKKCGLMEGDTLRMEGATLIAVRDRSILPIDFAELPAQACAYLKALVGTRGRLAVAEFTPLGLTDAYYVNITA